MVGIRRIVKAQLGRSGLKPNHFGLFDMHGNILGTGATILITRTRQGKVAKLPKIARMS